ncbi:MAG: cation:proton antiporter [Kiritimatiellia bacterium]|jgi:Kef-type K+ transport system membrane component KefB/mannitol/fructose-specific phosphotransferase system IIA component (Ntr-type)|nr:cation:proton antiporter [Kiritimatiellia bacterium]
MFPLTDPILVFTLLILTLLTMPLLAERLKLPDIVLLLGAGTLLGPNGFGILERNMAVTLFGSVGLLYIMFLAGLEIDLYRFGKTRWRSILFGLLTFAIPQGLGTLIGHHVLGFGWPTSLLLASMFASHTLLAYPLASRLGIARSEPVAVTVGATIITDTLALLVLAVVADAARGISMTTGFWAGILGGLAALVLLIWWGIPFLTRWFFNRVTETGGAQFLFVLTTVCGCAYLSHFAKMEPIIGAFLAGAAFNRLIPEHSVLMSRVTFAGNTLFIPFFLLSVGMLVDPAAMLATPRTWLVGAVMIATVLLTKFCAAWLTGALYGYSPDGRRVMFGLSVVQAAATLAAVLVGYQLNLFDATVLNGAIAMIAVTCPLGAWQVDRYGRRLAAGMPPRARPSQPDRHLLVPIANPAFATKMLDLAFLAHDPSRAGAIHPITIVRDADNIEAAITRGETLLAQCLAHAASADIPVTPTVRVDANISDGLIRAVKQLRVSLMITGWSGNPSRLDRLFGSVMDRLITHCPSRLFLCRLKCPLNTTRRLLVPLPPLAERRSDIRDLLADIKRLSRQMGADLRVYLAGRDTAPLRRQVESAKPERPVTFIEAATLPEARARMLADIREQDFLLLPCERPNSVLWTPTLDTLTTLLIARLPENNLVLAYPALATYEEEGDPASAPEEENEGETLRFVACDLDAGTPRDRALRQMVSRAFPSQPEAAEEALRLLRGGTASYAVGLTSGIALLHAHCAKIEAPVLVAGQGAAAWDLPNLPEPPRLMLLLLNPTSRSPERHLKTLAELGRRFRDPAVAGALRASPDAAHTVTLLAGKPERAD